MVVDLMAQAVLSFILVIFIVMLILWLAKYRREILEWVAKPPHEDDDLRDFDTLTDYAVPEDSAIERIRERRKHRKEIRRRISAEDGKTETPK